MISRVRIDDVPTSMEMAALLLHEASIKWTRPHSRNESLNRVLVHERYFVGESRAFRKPPVDLPAGTHWFAWTQTYPNGGSGMDAKAYRLRRYWVTLDSDSPDGEWHNEGDCVLVSSIRLGQPSERVDQGGYMYRSPQL